MEVDKVDDIPEIATSAYKLRVAFFSSCFVFVFLNSFEILVNELNALLTFHSFYYGGRGDTSGNTNVEHHRKN